MPDMAPFVYRAFYDVPRFLVATYQKQKFLFESAFDDDLDEYPDVYQVFLLGDVSEDVLQGSWVNLAENAKNYLGEVPIKDVVFDATLRREIKTDVLDKLLDQLTVAAPHYPREELAGAFAK